MRPNWAQGEQNYTLNGEELIVLFTKSETLHSCRFETKMRQNAPNPISISIFSGVTPPESATGALPQTRREGREEMGGKGRGGKGKEGDGKGRWKFASLPLGDRRPWCCCKILSNEHANCSSTCFD